MVGALGEADRDELGGRACPGLDGRVTKDEAVALPKEARRLLAALPPEEDDA